MQSTCLIRPDLSSNFQKNVSFSGKPNFCFDQLLAKFEKLTPRWTAHDNPCQFYLQLLLAAIFLEISFENKTYRNH